MYPFIARTLSTLPKGPFDVQVIIGELAVELAINWLTGDDLQSPTDRGAKWLEAKRNLGWALTEGQRVMGRRLMVGSIWVSQIIIALIWLAQYLAYLRALSKWAKSSSGSPETILRASDRGSPRKTDTERGS